MSLPLTRTAGGQHHFTYEGPCGVSGVAQVQSFSLSEVDPTYLRDDGNILVREQGLMEVQALDPAITAVDFSEVWPPAPAIPQEWRVTITSPDANAQMRVRLHLPHSIAR